MKKCKGLTNVTLVEGAVWPQSTSLRAIEASAKSWGHRYAEADSPDAANCRAYSIDEIIVASKCGRCDLLKLDIEGAELQLFSVNEQQWIDSVDMLLIECHSPEAEAAVRRACPPDKFDTSMLGEKLFVRRK